MKSSNFIRFALILSTVALLAGCAFGQSIRYSEANVRLDLNGDATVAVVVHDQRPDVLEGDEPANWVGELRSLYGIPYDVTTDNGEPIADNMSRIITRALNRRGFNATTAIVPYSLDKKAVIRRALSRNSEKIVLLRLNEYESDTYFGSSLEFDVELSVLDGSGDVLASRHWDGDVDLDDISIPEAFTRKVEQWFTAPEIVEALESRSLPTTI